jgi:HEAT repeat protein
MLSAPSAHELETWEEHWPAIDDERRRWIAGCLKDTAEASFEVEYKGLFAVLLDDPDPEIRAVAIDGLWEARDAQLAARFTEFLATDPDERVRARAAAALGRYVLAGELDELSPDVSRRAVVVLVDAAADEGEDIEVRRRATESAGFADDPEVRRIIHDGLESGHESLRAGALRAIGNSADESWEPVVIAGLVDPLRQLRFEAARAAGELVLSGAVEGLIALAEGEDREVQHEAVWALGEIGGRAAGRALERLAARSTDPDLLGAVEDALAMVALDEGAIQFPQLEPDVGPLEFNGLGSEVALDEWPGDCTDD